jgi:hypothetical protein
MCHFELIISDNSSAGSTVGAQSQLVAEAVVAGQERGLA